MITKSFYGTHESDFEKLHGDSDTIPDQSLSVRDILYRFTRGSMSIPPIEQGDDEDIDSPDTSFDDLSDAYVASRDIDTLAARFKESVTPHVDESSDKSVYSDGSNDS